MPAFTTQLHPTAVQQHLVPQVSESSMVSMLHQVQHLHRGSQMVCNQNLTCSIERTRSSAPRSKGSISCTTLPSDTCTSHTA